MGGEFLNFSKCLSKEISQRLETEKVAAGSNSLKNKERISRYAVTAFCSGFKRFHSMTTI